MPSLAGGREGALSSSVGIPGLRGCVADLILATDYHVDLITQAAAGQNIDYCWPLAGTDQGGGGGGSVDGGGGSRGKQDEWRVLLDGGGLEEGLWL